MLVNLCVHFPKTHVRNVSCSLWRQFSHIILSSRDFFFFLTNPLLQRLFYFKLNFMFFLLFQILLQLCLKPLLQSDPKPELLFLYAALHNLLKLCLCVCKHCLTHLPVSHHCAFFLSCDTVNCLASV